MKSKRLICCTILMLSSVSTSAQGVDSWYLRGTAGYSMLDDQTGATSADLAAAGDAEFAIDNGYTAGLGLGYQLNPSWSVELYWEYRSHAAETTLGNGERFDDGNYASNIFYLNGNYHWATDGPWQPYVGAGIGWVEEIDIDLERSGEPERSFSDSGYVGFQFYTGVNYALSPKWSLQGEIRYSVFDDIDLDEESGSGTIEGLDYDPFTAQLGVVYRF